MKQTSSRCSHSTPVVTARNRELKEWIRDISRSEVNGSTIAGTSYYAAGDYTMPHTDRAPGRTGDTEKRRIAYILHLTKQWNPKFGGDLIFMNPTYHFHPSFNSMTLFPVSESSWHFVSPVAGITPEHIKVGIVFRKHCPQEFFLFAENAMTRTC